MKLLFIVANFKSHLTKTEAKKWLEEFNSLYKFQENKKVILCPSFTLLQMFREFIDSKNILVEVGGQNISRLPEGPYTGEVNGSQIKDFAQYVLIGHSERRQFGEDESVVEEKIKMSIDYNLVPILFVQDENYTFPANITICVYEPPGAISTSPNPVVESPDEASSVAQKLKTGRNRTVLYGGSVNSENVKSFTKMNDISGVVVGNASLDVKEFLKIIEMA